MIKTVSLLSSKVLVIKIGSSLLIKKNSFNSNWLDNFSSEIDFLKKKKLKVIVVASGSVSLGKKYLGIKDSKILKINEKQACAACGQSLLMNYFIRFFEKKNLKVAQILLTFSETEDRRKNLNIRETINTLLDSGVIPVINENDSTATDELKFGDNDRLAARVGQITDADTLILLSDVEGLFDSNPFIHITIKHNTYQLHLIVVQTNMPPTTRQQPKASSRCELCSMLASRIYFSKLYIVFYLFMILLNVVSISIILTSYKMYSYKISPGLIVLEIMELTIQIIRDPSI
mgnify:CR=1 FL=1